ncbi:MAG TPA: phospholipase D-like domain-containing protein [Steroidobacteraceae bacterium]|nr:phospholipase D-like domain-containing protein [Steroidobacteraceae bacterium]
MAEFEPMPRRRLRKRVFVWLLLAIWLSVAVWNLVKPMPAGTAAHSSEHVLSQSQVQFLHDLTHADPKGQPIYEQQIFDEALRMIDAAETVIVADFFLINDQMGSTSNVHRALSREFIQHLIARKQAKPQLAILLITDPINEIYGGTHSTLFAQLRSAGIDVVTTDLARLRDSNPLYSSLWRIAFSWWGNSAEGGSAANPFDDQGPGITVRSWLALLNFKANHRKVLVTDSAEGNLRALVTSANPHDASSAHSNVAIAFDGALAEEIIASELAVARFSGWRGHIYAVSAAKTPAASGADAVHLSFVTEQAIKTHLLASLRLTRNGDRIRLAVFYLSDRDVIDALIKAADRGVQVQVILDPNRDAFGRQKDGVPNRPVANELFVSSGERIQIRWYRTHGEQFHTKVAMITHGDRFIATLGSANYTRRNLENYNLEANVAIETGTNAPLALQMSAYFDRIWNNDGPAGTEFTAPLGAFRDEDAGDYWRYRLMEATGLSTF